MVKYTQTIRQQTALKGLKNKSRRLRSAAFEVQLSHGVCVKSVQIWKFSWSVFSCIRTKKTPYLDTFHAVGVWGLPFKCLPTVCAKTVSSLFRQSS